MKIRSRKTGKFISKKIVDEILYNRLFGSLSYDTMLSMLENMGMRESDLQHYHSPLFVGYLPTWNTGRRDEIMPISAAMHM
jgi:hypothetical protein